ncbi:MAG: hypothetical protein IT260_03210 [Saprospiraceae bacterium]|nr:hypothetical protein [Saprospiraceae bacterium]
MEKSQLRQLIQAFSAAEKREARKFLESPYFNRRRDVVQLFDWFCAQEAPEKGQAKRHLFGEMPVDDQELRLRMTYLHRLLERYLAQKEMEADDTALRLHLAGSYRRRGLAPQFERVRKSLEKTLATSALRDTQHHEWQYRLHWETHQLSHTRNPTELGHLQAASRSADVAYLMLKLRLICLLTVHRTLYSVDASSPWEAEVIAFAEQHAASQHPAVAVYLHCYRMMRYPEEESHFQQFKHLLLQDVGIFSREEMHGLFIWAVNYCIRRLNTGEHRYYREVSELYKPGLESGYLLENGVLPRFTYHNVVAAGLQTGDLEWVEFFIYQYKNTLEKQYRESAFSFNLARLEFARRHYGAVLDLLQKANYRDVLVNLATKTLLLKTYYELDAHDLLQSHLDAMQNYISRKRILGYHRTNCLNIIRYTGKLLALNFSDKKAVQQLRDAIAQEDPLWEKDWFLAQLG